RRFRSTSVYLPLVTWLTGIPRRARGCPALHPWRDPCRRVSGDGMRVEPSLMHPEGGSWTEVRTHTPSKFSKVLHEPLAPIPLERSKFRENGSQPSSNQTCRGKSPSYGAPTAPLVNAERSQLFSCGSLSIKDRSQIVASARGFGCPAKDGVSLAQDSQHSARALLNAANRLLTEDNQYSW